MTSFIHIGKTGGTTINNILRDKIPNYKEYHHVKNYNNSEKYIIWIRNPISRFVSAFNHSYYGICADPTTIKKFDIKHCLMPGRMLTSLKTPYVFSSKYDALFKCFNSANHLAENLYSEDDPIMKEKAVKLMLCEDEHLFKGIGWYLNNGNFIKNKNDKILFIGRMENMKEDIIRLSKKLGVVLDENTKLRENIYVDKSMKYLSPLAIKNIIEWYRNSDYLALNIIYKNGWITEKVLNSYYIYENE
jgi:hypothetical protein